MAVERTTNNQPSVVVVGCGGSKSALEFDSFVRVDLKTFSQSELYSLSRSSSYAFDLSKPENDVIPNIQSDRRSTCSITTITTTGRRVFAFSHRRGPRRRISGSDADAQLTENRLILTSLKKLVAEGEVCDSNPSREVQKRKRKRKSKNDNEFENLGLINVNGEAIDLRFLASAADGVFESELNQMTEGMVREDEFLGFLNGLEGSWGSSRKRRKYVDATLFVKALPVNWKILLSLRPRVHRPSLYCRRFVSPSDVHFNSCKDVAFYLKSQSVTSDANPPEEGAMMHTLPDYQVDLESGAQVHRSSHPASKTEFLEINNLHNVPTYDPIKCNICMDSFTSTAGLESHMHKSHGNNALTRKRSVPHGLLLIREPRSVKQKTVVNKDTVTRRNELENIPVNGEGSSSEPKNNSDGNRNLKTRCIWCLVEFFREPVDAETLASSCGFICPKCKKDVSWQFESALSELTQHTDN
ncbi:hypothetical protein L1987_15023 [Smallanthus sonchifolius]|uniref:Uncharacterized protein n=1 Tax=Smallanthus sonchifolius TaxID=185202 RepID=A0ACB9J6Q3_9ASTR|nr:hypothetical protein L1987_15023 [Smallanthus sonchifolius]